MLVLSRRIGESIVVADRIVVQVLSVKGGKVRLGIAAPPDVAIDREEIHERRGEFSEAELMIAK